MICYNTITYMAGYYQVVYLGRQHHAIKSQGSNIV